MQGRGRNPWCVGAHSSKVEKLGSWEAMGIHAPLPSSIGFCHSPVLSLGVCWLTVPRLSAHPLKWMLEDLQRLHLNTRVLVSSGISTGLSKTICCSPPQRCPPALPWGQEVSRPLDPFRQCAWGSCSFWGWRSAGCGGCAFASSYALCLGWEVGGEERVRAFGWVELWECLASRGAGGGSSGRALRGVGDGPSGCWRGACACVHACVCVCVPCCLAKEPPLRPDLVLVHWRLRRQLLRLSPGLRCGRLDFLPAGPRPASGRAATGCWRQGLPSGELAALAQDQETAPSLGSPPPPGAHQLLLPAGVASGEVGEDCAAQGGGFRSRARCRALPWTWGGSTLSRRELLTGGELQPLHPTSTKPCLPLPPPPRLIS